MAASVNVAYAELDDALMAYEKALEEAGFTHGAEAVHWLAFGLPIPAQLRSEMSRDSRARGKI